MAQATQDELRSLYVDFQGAGRHVMQPNQARAAVRAEYVQHPERIPRIRGTRDRLTRGVRYLDFKIFYEGRFARPN
jgi:hypothetical protein